MFAPQILRRPGIVLVLGGLVAAFGTSAVAQTPVPSGPMEITTDTPEYCQELLHRVGNLERSATAPVPREITDLTSEGQRMCDHGQTRGGIMRVRSALMMLEKRGGTAYR